MRGRVSAEDQATIAIEVHPSATLGHPIALDAWIDTGFLGDLMLPVGILASFGFSNVGVVEIVLANGQEVETDAYEGWIEWFGVYRFIKILAGGDGVSLLGTDLLKGRRLLIDYGSRVVSLN